MRIKTCMVINTCHTERDARNCEHQKYTTNTSWKAELQVEEGVATGKWIELEGVGPTVDISLSSIFRIPHSI